MASVTVVIPCYNAERYIEDAIQSVLRQYSSGDTFIIVVDDGSTDASVNIVRKYRRVKLIQHDRNLGPCAATETGFKASTSDYTCLLAADDMLTNPYQLFKQAAIMKQHNLDWCYCSINEVGESVDDFQIVHTKWLLHPVFDNLVLAFPKLCALLITMRNPVNASSLMIKTDSFRKHNLSWYPKERSVCDGYLIVDMLLKGLRGRAIRCCGAFYRIHAGQVSNTEIHKESHKRFNRMVYKRIIGV
jgi:glycosyltransferase involved in cell wall biosynthesis